MENNFTKEQFILKCLVVILFVQPFIYAQFENGSFEFEGYTRYYKVFLPQNFQPNMPVVFSLHGYKLNAQQQIDYTLMHDVADTAGFIVVYPDAIYPGFNSGLIGYPGLPPLPNVNDVGFISALIDTLEARYDIDTNRVYSCGLSNGGIMTYRLACELGNRFAAVASVAGVLTDITGNNCNPMRSIPVLHIHGTADGVVTYNGGLANLWSVESTLNHWIQNNNCQLPPDTVFLPDLDPNDGCTVQKISYTNCSGTSKIIFYKVIDGGHSWPGAPSNPSWSYPTNRD
ncbi:MAG: PHB depolymerase family esterase, partial [Ignavibacteriaceae bacterium]